MPKGGNVIIEDGLAEETQEETQTEGAKGGTKTQEVKEDDNTESQSGGEQDLNGGAEDLETGEAAGEVESGVSKAEAVAKPDPLLEINKVIEDKFKSLEEKLKPAEPPRQLTEEEWATHEQTWGMPRNAIQKTINLGIQIKNEMKEYVDAQFAELRKDSIMADVAKQNGIPDYKRLEPGIKEFLSAFDSKHHTNPELLKRAMIYSRGLNASKDAKKIQSNDERNRQVVNRLKPGKADVRTAGGGAKGLTAIQRQAASDAGMSEEEYVRLKGKTQMFAA